MEVMTVSNFNGVANVWNNLEAVYRETAKKKSVSRIDYVKKLLLWDSGEVGYRKLTGMLAMCDDAPAEKVSELLGKLEIARKNVLFYDRVGQEPDSLTDFATIDASTKQGVWDSCNSVYEVTSLSKFLVEGNLFPVNRVCCGCVKTIQPAEYYATSVCDTDLMQIFMEARAGVLSNALSEDIQLGTAKFIASKVREGTLQRKVIVADSSSVDVFVSRGVHLIKVDSNTNNELYDGEFLGAEFSLVVVM